MASRSESDEHYVLNLCDEVLGIPASRQHRFEWLRGDFSEKKQSYSYLPVDGYWESLALVVEYAERQHSEPVKKFDARDTVSGVTRGIQRRIYDERRIDFLPKNGLRLIVIAASVFKLRRHKIVRQPERDVEVVRGILIEAGIPVA
jgi:hypothetical protein